VSIELVSRVSTVCTEMLVTRLVSDDFRSEFILLSDFRSSYVTGCRLITSLADDAIGSGFDEFRINFCLKMRGRDHTWSACGKEVIVIVARQCEHSSFSFSCRLHFRFLPCSVNIFLLASSNHPIILVT
jgi:hypothetical protein